MSKRTIVSSAQYHDFEQNPIYTGKYVNEQRADILDEDTGEIENKVIGFLFEDESGEQSIITNAWSIEKALNTEDEKTNCLVKDSGLTIEIEFLGKVQKNGKGRPFNRFKVSLID